ncbi:hypothetical protein [Sphingobacterium hungaricum]
MRFRFDEIESLPSMQKTAVSLSRTKDHRSHREATKNTEFPCSLFIAPYSLNFNPPVIGSIAKNLNHKVVAIRRYSGCSAGSSRIPNNSGFAIRNRSQIQKPP